MPKPISLETAIDLFPACRSHVTGSMIPLPKLRELAREWFGKADQQSLDDTVAAVLLALADDCVSAKRDYDGMREFQAKYIGADQKAREAWAKLEGLQTVFPAADWRDDDGACLWWSFPICEPPLIGHGPGAGETKADGTPTRCAKGIASGWLTHFSKIPVVWDGDGTALCVVSRFSVEE